MRVGSYHALLIAVETYSDAAVPRLEAPVRDAEKLRAVLTSQYRFDPNHVTLLRNPSREEIMAALFDLSDGLGRDDNLLIFFAGHGYWDERTQQGYWLPADARRANPARWISNADVRDALRRINTRHTLLISDACFSGGILLTRDAFGTAGDAALARLYELPSRKAMTSGSKQIVPDRSHFLEYLIKRLEENRAPLLPAGDLFSSFRTAVMNNSPVTPQYGTIYGAGDEGGEFLFAARESALAQTPPTAREQAPPMSVGRPSMESMGSPRSRINLHLARGQPAKYTPPLCPVKTGNAAIDKGAALLRNSYSANSTADRNAILADARQNLVTAITQEAQEGNSAAWYYLARVALMRGDPVEADSGFTKAQYLTPACQIDISQYRQNNWALIANIAIEFQKKGEADTALALFRDASVLFQGLPHVYSNMGVIFANTGKEDSAAIYFKRALAIAEKDTSLVEDRNGAALNLAIMYQRLNRHREAIAVLHRYLAWKPGDTEARKALAQSFRAGGMADSAQQVESGVADQLARGSLDSLDTADLMAVGVAAFNNQKYPEALNAFAKSLKRNPWSRDARYNLTNTYFAMKDYEHLIEHASKLLDNEPMSADALRLLAQGQRSLHQDEAVLRTAERLVAQPFTIEISSFQMGATSARLNAEAIGRTPQDAAGKPLRAAPITLAVEFVDVGGAVIDTKEITIPVLASDAKHPIHLEGNGAGIAGWRYRVKRG